MRYRKKPVTIEAVRWPSPTGWPEHWTPVPFSLRMDDAGAALVVRTIEGEMLAREGDYIVRGTHGEFYPVKREIFEANYEPVVGALE